jgi:serine/threonine-protein kinase
VCAALSEAHANGIIHRDLKPANIHLEAGDRVRVLDFGIATIMSDGELDDGDLTAIGTMVGTFDYMPVEQMIGGSCDARSDVFTLGVVMYEVITGTRPYGDATTPAARLSALLGGTPAPISTRAPVPADLDRIVARCIAREPDERYQSARELAEDLARLPTVDRRPRMLPATTLPGIVPPKPRPNQAWPRLADGTSPIQNKPRSGRASGATPRARWRAIAWLMMVVTLSALVGVLVARG